MVLRHGPCQVVDGATGKERTPGGRGPATHGVVSAGVAAYRQNLPIDHIKNNIIRVQAKPHWGQREVDALSPGEREGEPGIIRIPSDL